MRAIHFEGFSLLNLMAKFWAAQNGWLPGDVPLKQPQLWPEHTNGWRSSPFEMSSTAQSLSCQATVSTSTIPAEQTATRSGQCSVCRACDEMGGPSYFPWTPLQINVEPKRVHFPEGVVSTNGCFFDFHVNLKGGRCPFYSPNPNAARS